MTREKGWYYWYLFVPGTTVSKISKSHYVYPDGHTECGRLIYVHDHNFYPEIKSTGSGRCKKCESLCIRKIAS